MPPHAQGQMTVKQRHTNNPGTDDLRDSSDNLHYGNLVKDITRFAAARKPQGSAVCFSLLLIEQDSTVLPSSKRSVSLRCSVLGG